MIHDRVPHRRPTDRRIALSTQRLLVTICLVLVAATAFAQTTVTLTASRDNTLYENTEGSLSNGAGEFLFVGRTGPLAGQLIRRAVLAFDLSAIPPGSTILSAQLGLTMSRTNAGPQTIDMLRLLADWGESDSDAFGAEGAGIEFSPGDTTWIHTFAATDFWTTAGGDLSATVSASQTVDDIEFYTWGSTAQMVADVQGWVDDPSSNFGWILLGNEEESQTAKRFNSRENLDNETVPQLTIQFANVVFGDGFESGDTTAWDNSVGLPR